MSSHPRTGEYYRPIIEDLHAVVQGWRGTFAFRLQSSLIWFAVIVTAAFALLLGLAWLTAPDAEAVPAVPAPAVNDQVIAALEERGAVFSRAGDHVIHAVLNGEAFSDRDLRHLAKMPFLQSIVIMNADVTDEGLAELVTLQHLRSLVLVNTRVTQDGVERFRRVTQRTPRYGAVHVVLETSPDAADGGSVEQ